MPESASSHTPQALTSLERAVLEVIQCAFPLCSDPYAAIAAQVGAVRAEVHAAVTGLRRRGIIRRLGGSFAAGKLDYVSALVAVRVDPACLEAVAAVVGAHAEVTHSYERAHPYNLWFTVIAEDQARLETILGTVRQCTGVEAVEALPATRTFKIRVDFSFSRGATDAG